MEKKNYANQRSTIEKILPTTNEDEMKKLLAPSLYIGRCPDQVTAMIKKVKPLLKDVAKESAEINL